MAGPPVIDLTRPRAHPHRANFGPNGLPKQYCHVDPWGAEPREFFEVVFNVPTRLVYDEKGCGCTSHIAQAWVESVDMVPVEHIVWSDDMQRLTVG